MKSPRPPKFPVELDDPQRAALERIRIKLGARSAADAIRKLIEENDPERRPPYRQGLPQGALPSEIWPDKPLTEENFAEIIKEALTVKSETVQLGPAKPLSGITGKPSPKPSVKTKGGK